MSIVHTVFIALALLQSPHPGMAGQGSSVMGFDQDKTTHHFYLFEDGGSIDVSVNDGADVKNRDAIRSHLPHIAMMFGEGNFEAPMLVHETQNVPGTAELAQFNGRIKYSYVETTKGGQVNIVTTDRQALAAFHAFLKYQIVEHRTGDPTVPTKRK